MDISATADVLFSNKSMLEANSINSIGFIILLHDGLLDNIGVVDDIRLIEIIIRRLRHYPQEQQ